MLQTEVAVERSAGKFDVQQLLEALKYFGFDFDHPPSDDNHVIGTFQSRVQDSPLQEVQMREQLKIIGIYRRSRQICEFAENSMFH